jgi:hypothetical protein
MSPNLGITICGYLSIGCCVLAAIRKFVDEFCKTWESVVKHLRKTFGKPKPNPKQE